LEKGDDILVYGVKETRDKKVEIHSANINFENGVPTKGNVPTDSFPTVPFDT